MLASDIARDVRQAVVDMTSALKDLPAFHRDVAAGAELLVTPRAIARVLHGLTTPLFPGNDWRRHR
jgi:hypothetical protein